MICLIFANLTNEKNLITVFVLYFSYYKQDQASLQRLHPFFFVFKLSFHLPCLGFYQVLFLLIHKSSLYISTASDICIVQVQALFFTLHVFYLSLLVIQRVLVFLSVFHHAEVFFFFCILFFFYFSGFSHNQKGLPHFTLLL